MTENLQNFDVKYDRLAFVAWPKVPKTVVQSFFPKRNMAMAQLAVPIIMDPNQEGWLLQYPQD